MSICVPQHDESLMPIKLGSVLRCPEYSWGKWGVRWDTPSEYRGLLERSEQEYRSEWDGGTAERMKLVSDASERAGFGDHPQKIRDSCAVAVVNYLKGHDGYINILDIGAGAGASAKTVFERLDENIRDEVCFTLIDPSNDVLQVAYPLVKGLGARCVAIRKADTSLLEFVKPESQDVAIAVASIHHHARIPFETYYDALKPSGLFVSADWHNSLWEEPYRVRRMLQRFPGYDAGRADVEFERVYPVSSLAVHEPIAHAEAQANEDITNFWLGYYDILKDTGTGSNTIWPHEGHRPHARYMDDMRTVGFTLEEPVQILPNSSLLMLIAGRK